MHVTPSPADAAPLARLLRVIAANRARALLVPGLPDVLDAIELWVRDTDRRLEALERLVR